MPLHEIAQTLVIAVCRSYFGFLLDDGPERRSAADKGQGATIDEQMPSFTVACMCLCQALHMPAMVLCEQISHDGLSCWQRRDLGVEAM